MNKITINLTKERLFGGFDSTIWSEYRNDADKIAQHYCDMFQHYFHTDEWYVVSNQTDMVIELLNPTIDNSYRIDMFLNLVKTYPEKRVEFELDTVFASYI